MLPDLTAVMRAHPEAVSRAVPAEPLMPAMDLPGDDGYEGWEDGSYVLAFIERNAAALRRQWLQG